MLVEFRVANFLSFREEQVLSMVASKDDSHPENIIEGEKFNLLKTAAVYGANASGKSNLIKALDCMINIVGSSATKMNQGDTIPGVAPFRLDVKTQEQPSTFEITIMIEETRYEYGFSANTERIYKEYLHAYPPPHKRMQRWYEREYLFETGKTDWIFRGPLEKHKKILSDMTRENGLILSRGAELNIEALKELYLWFSSKVLTFDMSERPDWLMQATAQGLKKNKKLQDVALKLIRNADLGIDEISIVKKEKEKRGALATLFEQDFSLSKSDNYIIYTTHKISGSNKKEVFDLLKDESNGTKRYFALSIPFISVIYHGGVVLVDELDASMHPLLTRKLIEMFQIKQANKPGSQLIFSTHASEIMDPELFRRDQIWIVEKNKAGASELYSLYDFDPKDRPRNTEKFQRNYLAGRYGGVPKFGPIFEDLEFQ